MSRPEFCAPEHRQALVLLITLGAAGRHTPWPRRDPSIARGFFLPGADQSVPPSARPRKEGTPCGTSSSDRTSPSAGPSGRVPARSPWSWTTRTTGTSSRSTSRATSPTWPTTSTARRTRSRPAAATGRPWEFERACRALSRQGFGVNKAATAPHRGPAGGGGSLTEADGEQTTDGSASRHKWPDRLTGAQSLMRSMEQEGVDVIFGIPGGAILPAYDPLLDSLDPPRPDAPRAGRRPRGRGLRPRHRPGRRVHGHVGPGRLQPGHRARRRLHGLDPPGRHHRPGPDRRDRQRRVPGGLHHRHRHAGHQAHLAGHRPRRHPARHPRGVPHRLDRAVPARSWSTSPRTS